MRQNSEVNGLGFSVGGTVRRRATDVMESGTAATQAEPIDFAADQPLGPPPAPHYQLLPIRQLMGVAHYMSQPALSQVPGRGGEAVASRARGRAAARWLLPCRLHGAGADRRHFPIRSSVAAKDNTPSPNLPSRVPVTGSDDGPSPGRVATSEVATLRTSAAVATPAGGRGPGSTRADR